MHFLSIIIMKTVLWTFGGGKMFGRDFQGVGLFPCECLFKGIRNRRICCGILIIFKRKN